MADSILPEPTKNPFDLFIFSGEIGRGNFGVVKKCSCIKTGKKYACKIIKKSDLKTPAEIEEVRREVQIMQKLSLFPHPNIVALNGVYEDWKCIYLVMELCDGGELYDKIRSSHFIGESEAAHIFREIVDATSFLHFQGILHRDLKPENILLSSYSPSSYSSSSSSPSSDILDNNVTTNGSQKGTNNNNNNAIFSENSSEVVGIVAPKSGIQLGVKKSVQIGLKSLQKVAQSGVHMGQKGGKQTKYRVKLADFGLAIFLKPGKLTQGCAGSRFYESPEVICDGTYGFKADAWSLGVILYAMLSGRLPFLGDNKRALMGSICKGKLTFSEHPWPSVSENAKKLIRKMLTVDPEKRISVSEVLKDPWFSQFCPMFPVSMSVPVSVPVSSVSVSNSSVPVSSVSVSVSTNSVSANSVSVSVPVPVSAVSVISTPVPCPTESVSFTENPLCPSSQFPRKHSTTTSSLPSSKPPKSLSPASPSTPPSSRSSSPPSSPESTLPLPHPLSSDTRVTTSPPLNSRSPRKFRGLWLLPSSTSGSSHSSLSLLDSPPFWGGPPTMTTSPSLPSTNSKTTPPVTATAAAAAAAAGLPPPLSLPPPASLSTPLSLAHPPSAPPPLSLPPASGEKANQNRYSRRFSCCFCPKSSSPREDKNSVDSEEVSEKTTNEVICESESEMGVKRKDGFIFPRRISSRGCERSGKLFFNLRR